MKDHVIQFSRLTGNRVNAVVQAGLRAVGMSILKVRKCWRRWRLKRATAYVNRFGYELDLDSRVIMDNRAYYVFSINHYRNGENKREVQISLIGVPQYREMKRRMKKHDSKGISGRCDENSAGRRCGNF